MTIVLKFRAWHKARHKMRLVHKIEWLTDWNFLVYVIEDVGINSIPDYVMVNWLNENLELMQWTGLQDINGKDIYVGDVLELNQEDYRIDELENVVIEYNPNKNGIHARYLKDDEWDNLHTIKIDTCTLLGNIYENPKLLEH